VIEKLSIKQKQFCDAYLANNGNATAAAISAGYSKSSAQQIGYENLKKQSIADYIDHVSNGNKPKLELNSDLERTVLKWRQLDKNNETTYPKYGQIVLAVNNNKEFAVCMFDGIKRKEFVIEERETTIVLNNVYAWMELPNAPIVSHIENDEYLIEQTTLETFDIIDAITPALREAVKHLLIQQEGSKFLMQQGVNK
jgi:hypothetical protein